MMLLQRNLQTVYYSIYQGKEELIDENDFATGEYKVVYKKPKAIKCNLSPASGIAQSEMFGNLDSYDRVLIIDDTTLNIDENTVFIIENKVKFVDGVPNYDYKVKRVAKSLNTLSVVVTKVKVS